MKNLLSIEFFYHISPQIVIFVLILYILIILFIAYITIECDNIECANIECAKKSLCQCNRVKFDHYLENHCSVKGCFRIIPPIDSGWQTMVEHIHDVK